MESNAVIVTGKLLETVALIIFSGAVFARISKLLHLPDVVMYVLAGIIIGPCGLNLLHFNNDIVNQAVLTFGASYILFDGGMEISLHILNKVKISVALLSTFGVIISAFITGYLASKLLHIGFIYALLLGAVISSTDPSVLVPLFKNLNISNKLKQAIIAESAFNDALGAIAAFTIIGLIEGGTFSLKESILEFAKAAGGGIVVGAAAGFFVLFLVAERKFEVLSDFKAQVIIAMVAASYCLASYFGSSGFMAVFIFGIIIGNKHVFKITVPEHSSRTQLYFKDVMTSLIRMMIFIILGSHIDFAILSKYWPGALLVVILFIFVARPVSVFFSVIFDRKAQWKFKEVLYLMWARETGVIPAALAGMIVTMKVPNAQIISSVTSMAIIITMVFQASTKKYLAKLLGLQ
jgi:potassium/hydrogen antiporter